MTAPEVLVAEAREALLNGSVFRAERAEAAPGGVKAVIADGVEFPTGRGLYAISEVTPSCGHRRTAGPPGLLGGAGSIGAINSHGASESISNRDTSSRRPADPWIHCQTRRRPQYALASIQASTSKTRRVVTSAGRAAAHR